MRRLLLVPLLALMLVQPAPAAKPAPSWAQPQIKLVTSRGLMGGDAAAFRPDDELTQGALTDLAAGLGGLPAAPTAAPAAPATIAQLDSRLVKTLGLADEASSFAAAFRAAGVAVPSRFGTEVVARLLGLRTNHPAGHDDLELLPNDPATRAEAAYSAARVLQFSGWEVRFVEEAAAAFALPTLTSWQQQILRSAASFIGYPYVWGGESETTNSPFGAQAQGGFDCSGFVWRVFKLQPYVGAPQLAAVLRGRTTMEMSGEVPRAKRIAAPALAPADILFFGAHGPKSKPAEVDHTGISLGNGWLIHSSGQGVALASFDGWYARRFAWARRPLTEAGLR
jgi:cell wall-associated NlpC family hydrolase